MSACRSEYDLRFYNEKTQSKASGALVEKLDPPSWNSPDEIYSIISRSISNNRSRVWIIGSDTYQALVKRLAGFLSYNCRISVLSTIINTLLLNRSTQKRAYIVLG